MLKILWCAAYFGAALSLSGAVLTFNNFERNGIPVLVPQVREYRAAETVLKLPKVLTVSVPKGEELVVEQLDSELRRFGLSAKTADKAALCRFELADRGVPKNGEGYCLEVNREGIVVRSLSAAGLFYGAQTLCNLIRNAATPELRGCSVIDWPEFKDRTCQIQVKTMPRRDIPSLKKTIDMLAQLRINSVFMQFGERFPMSGNPLSKCKDQYTREELVELKEYCNRRHIDLIPTLQVLSHAMWMTYHPDWEKMSEGKIKFWESQCCIQNEQARALTKQMLLEQIELFKPQKFYIILDEIYLGPFRSCPRCKKADPDKLLADYMKFIKGVFKDTGVTPIVAQDSFVNRHNWPYGDKFRESLGKDFMVRWWSYRDNLPEDVLRPFKGYALIGNALVGKPLNVWNMSRLIRRYGGDSCNMVYWYYSNSGNLARLVQETPDSLGGFAIGADYLWSMRDTKYPDIGYDGTFEMMRRMYPELIAKPRMSGHAEPVALEGSVNAELSGSGKFPRFATDRETEELKAALAALPERFRLVTSPGGKYYGLRVSGYRTGRQKIGFNVHGRRAGRFSLLMTTSRPRNALDYNCYNWGRKRFKYAPAARLAINYTDGSSSSVDLRYRRDLTDWNRPFGGFNMRLAVRGLDADKSYYTFGIYDLDNPHPEKPVKNIVMSTTRLDGISPVILAASAWDLDRPYRAPVKPVDPTAVAKRKGVGPDPEIKTNIAADFENGMGDVVVNAPESVRKVMKVEIVDDPTSPSKSKVLKISVPGSGKYKGRAKDGKFLRISVDLPYRLAADAKGLLMDYKIVYGGDKGDFSTLTNYLSAGELGIYGKPYRQYLFTSAIQNIWIRACVPVAKLKSLRPMKDFTQTRTRRASFFFRDIKKPLEIYVDNIGDTPENISIVPIWKEGQEAEPI